MCIIEQIKTSPIVGVGIGNTEKPHNEFLHVAAWSGIPAYLFYLAALASMHIKAIINRINLTNTQIAALSASAAYLISSLLGNGMLQTISSFIVVLAL